MSALSKLFISFRAFYTFFVSSQLLCSSRSVCPKSEKKAPFTYYKKVPAGGRALAASTVVSIFLCFFSTLFPFQEVIPGEIFSGYLKSIAC